MWVGGMYWFQLFRPARPIIDFSPYTRTGRLEALFRRATELVIFPLIHGGTSLFGGGGQKALFAP